MYDNEIATKDQALCHLFFHCCMKDGQFQASEIEDVSDKFVHLGLQTTLNFKEELVKYRSYAINLSDETAYLEHIFNLIHPVNALALYAYCAELVVIDQLLDPQEDRLLAKIGGLLGLGEQEQATAKKLVVQKRAVELQKIF